MNADRVEVTWDEKKKNWLIRIKIGEEVIRRYCKEPKEADDQALKAAAEKTALDEGYSVAQDKLLVQR